MLVFWEIVARKVRMGRSRGEVKLGTAVWKQAGRLLQVPGQAGSHGVVCPSKQTKLNTMYWEPQLTLKH